MTAYLGTGGRIIFLNMGAGLVPAPTGVPVVTINGAAVPCPLYTVTQTDVWVRLPDANVQTGATAALTLNVPGVTAGAVAVANNTGTPLFTATAPTSPPTMKLGLNLFPPSYYSTGRVYADIARQFSAWIVPAGSVANVDVYGNLQSITGTAKTAYAAAGGEPNVAPDGNYLFRWAGTGAAQIADAASGNSLLPVVAQGVVDGWNWQIVTKSDNGTRGLYVWAAPPIDGVEIYPPGTYDAATGRPTQFFDPTWTAAYSGFDTYRLMDAFDTNLNPAVRPEDFKLGEVTTDSPLPTTPGVTQAMSFESAAEIVNHFGVNGWFNVPPLAEPAAVYAMARRLLRVLAPGREVYVEYGNEAWNGVDALFAHCTAIGTAAGASGYDATMLGYAAQSALAHTIFRSVWAAAGRSAELKCVLAWQNGTIPAQFQYLLGQYTARTGGVNPDVWAVAPYGGGPLPGAFALGQVGAFSPLAPADILDISDRSLNATWGVAQKVAADAAALTGTGIELCAYECGSSIVPSTITNYGYTAAQEVQWLANCAAAQRDLRMVPWHIAHLELLQRAGFTLANVYGSVGFAWGQYGQWGAQEYPGQPVSEAPNLAARLTWIAASEKNVAGS